MHPELSVLLTAMIPFVELKLAIPLGNSLGLSAATTFLFAVLGTIIPGALSLALLGPVSTLARKYSKWLDKLLTKLFYKTRKEHSKKFKRYGAIMLIAFVAIPIPGSSTVSGAVIAYIFGMSYWRSLGLISLGTAIAALLLTAGFESVFAIMDIFLK